MHNPYNASRPGHLFTGHERLRRRVIDGLANGRSFAISGGRRCGKTSLLLKLAEDIRALGGSATATFLPRLLDMQAEVPATTGEFFAAFARLLVQDTGIEPWCAGLDSHQSYRDFLAWAEAASVELARVHGPHWTAVFLVDELEVAAQHLQDDEAFHNLRNWLMVSPLRERVRVIVTGVGNLARLTARGSPLNNLEPEALGPLTPDEAGTLIAQGFPEAVVAEFGPRLLEQTGCHPWILQGVLGYLWEERHDVTPDAIVQAGRRFVRNRDQVFVDWARSFGAAGRAVFRCLAQADAPVHVLELRRALSKVDTAADAPVPTLDGLLRILGYHGVITEAADQTVQANGEIFLDWFRVYPDQPGPDPVPLPAPVPRNKRVFIVFGREYWLHAKVVEFLRKRGLEPIEWNTALEETQNGSPSVKEILDKAFEMAQAVVVMLTPDDEARLRPVSPGTQALAYDTSFTPQPRPNVIFEAGYAMSRFPTSTILVRFDKSMPLFSDIDGVYLLDLNSNLEPQEDFVRRLRACGLDVGNNGGPGGIPEKGGDLPPHN